MADYILGAATTGGFIAAIGVIDANIPNNLIYYIDLMMPF